MFFDASQHDTSHTWFEGRLKNSTLCACVWSVVDYIYMVAPFIRRRRALYVVSSDLEILAATGV